MTPFLFPFRGGLPRSGWAPPFFSPPWSVPESWGSASAIELSREAPIRFAIDYSSNSFDAFVADLSLDLESLVDGETVSTGDLLLEVNGQPFEAYRRIVEPYVRYSTAAGFQWKFAELISQRVFFVPQKSYSVDITYRLLRRNGQEYSISLPYRLPDENSWQQRGAPTFGDFELISDWQTFDFYVHQNRFVILLDWYGFREDLVKDIDALILYASENNLLGHSIIVDATRSRGGSKGAYAVQALSPKPFKTTFGNVRLSDVIEPFVTEKRSDFEAANINDSGVSETIDDGSWLMDWLNHDVIQGLQRGDEYSNNVPFKLAHAPKESDGVLQPATVHFTGMQFLSFGCREKERAQPQENGKHDDLGYSSCAECTKNIVRDQVQQQLQDIRHFTNRFTHFAGKRHPDAGL